MGNQLRYVRNSVSLDFEVWMMCQQMEEPDEIMFKAVQSGGCRSVVRRTSMGKITVNLTFGHGAQCEGDVCLSLVAERSVAVRT